MQGRFVWVEGELGRVGGMAFDRVGAFVSLLAHVCFLCEVEVR